MKVLTLYRLPETVDGVFGNLVLENKFPFCVTVELNWKDNQHDISNIAPGEYIFEQYLSPHRGYIVYKALNVPNRDAVEIHIANSIFDLKGCIGLGARFGLVETENNGSIWGVQESRDTFRRFMDLMEGDKQFKLVIVQI